MTAAGSKEPTSGMAVEVMKSPNDKKLYRFFVMENGLRVLLISDPDMHSDIAAAGQKDAEAPAADGMDTEGPGAAPQAASAGNGRKRAQPSPAQQREGKRAAAGKGRVTAALSDGEESSGDLESEGEDEESEGSEGEDESEGEGEEGESEDGSSSGEGEEGEEGPSGGEEEGEEDGEGAGGRRKKGGGGSKAPVKKAAAALAMGVGSFSDPEDLPGLSHYLEHMLFMGSEKYPNENEYDEYLTKHGGSSNAFTDLEVTNYHFEVAPPHLAGALDRFAQFFTQPLCLEGSMEREVLAVDSEFKQVLQDDHSRTCQLMCHTARDGHVYRKFAWGNRDSLWERPRAAGLDVRARLLEYYKQHYGADRATLVVLGGEGLDELQALVAGCFAAMPGGRGARPAFTHLPLPFEGRTLHVAPAVRDVHELRLTFQLPRLAGAGVYGRKSEHYLSHLLGHEGRGSLLSALKARGWASELSSGIDDDGWSSNSCCSLFGVDVTLTEAGLEAGPGAGLAVAALVFAFVNMLREAGPQEWVWREMACVAGLRWRFLEEEDPMDAVSRLAGSMHVVAPEHTLASDFLHTEWDPAHVRSLLDCMAPGGGTGSGGPGYRLDLLTRRYGEVKAAVLALAAREGAATAVGTEPWFGMEALSMQLPDSLVRSWAESAAPEEMRFPPPNPYLPTDLSLRCDDPEEAAVAEAAAATCMAALPPEVTSVLATPPLMLEDRPGLRLWHKLDSTFRTPRAALHLRLHSPAGHTDPRVAAAGHLALRLLEEGLREEAYLADVAGLHAHASPEGMAGLEFRVDGFSHKLPLLAERLLGALAALGAEGGLGADMTAHFPAVKEALVRKYRNFNMQVGKHASYTRLYMLCGAALHCDHILPAMEALQPEDIPPYIRTLLSRCHLEVFAAGNLGAGAARQLADRLAALLGPGCSLGAGERLRDACVVLPAAGAAGSKAEAAAGAGGEAGTGVVGAGEEGGAGVGEEAACCTEGGAAGTVVRLLAVNAAEENAAVELYYQLGPTATARERATLDLLDQVLYEPCYDTLRTKQQLGYTVYSGTRLTHGVSGFCIHVVSARYGPAHLDGCVESFLAAMAPRLRALTPAELAAHAGALAAAKLQRDRNLLEEAGRHWEHISSQRYDFLSREEEVAALEAVTADDVYGLFARHMLPPDAAEAGADGTAAPSGEGGAAAGGGGGRRKLAVHVRPRRPLKAEGKDAAEAQGGEKGDAEMRPAESAAEQGAEAGGRDGGAAQRRGTAAAALLAAFRATLPLHPPCVTAPPPWLQRPAAGG